MEWGVIGETKCLQLVRFLSPFSLKVWTFDLGAVVLWAFVVWAHCVPWSNRWSANLVCARSRVQSPIESNRYRVMVSNFLVEQHYKVVMSAHCANIISMSLKRQLSVREAVSCHSLLCHKCHKSVLILIWPYMWQRCKTPATNQLYELLTCGLTLWNCAKPVVGPVGR